MISETTQRILIKFELCRVKLIGLTYVQYSLTPNTQIETDVSLQWPVTRRRV